MFKKLFGRKQDDAKDVVVDVTENSAVVSGSANVEESVVTAPVVKSDDNSDASESKKKKGLLGGLKDAATKKMLEKQLKGLPPQQREMIMRAMESNPEFFEKIAKETEAAVKGGKTQMAASMEVMRKYQGEMQKIMMSAMQK